MKNLQKSFPFIIALLLTLSGCIGQKGEKKADCAPSQSFDQRSRECVGAQKPPQPLLDDITILEDGGAQEITLSYTDPNGSEASACKVNFTASNVWMRAPEWDTSALRADQAQVIGFNAANSISPITHPVERGNAFAQNTIATTAKLNAAAARTNSQMSQSIRVIADTLRVIGNIALGIPDALVQARGADAITEAGKLDVLAMTLDNMCSCIGGICKTVAVPDKNWFGSVGFTYTISDIYGTGPLEQVTLMVQSINDTPVPQPQDVNDNESTNSTATPIVFTVNAARDLEDDIFSNFFTYTVTNGTPDPMGSYIQFPMGRLYDCMGIGGSAVTDRTCAFTPTSGNDSGVGTQAAAFNFQGIDWFAKSTGTWGNNIKITMVEHPITRMGGLNGADGEDTVDITVVGNEIIIKVESDSEVVGVDNYDAHTVQNVIDAINADIFASAMVTVVANAPPGTPVTTGSVTLASGTNGLDSIEYKVNDGLSDSSWNGAVSINVFAQDDFPISTATTLTLTEDTPATFLLSYFDAEGDPAASCTAQSFAGQIRAGSTCTCIAGTCSVTIKPLPHQTASSSFEYQITAATGANNVGAFSNPDVTVNITAVNDPPYPVISQITPTPNESADAFPSPINFSLPAATEVEGESMVYTLKTLPTKGTLSGCVASNTVGVTINTGATCVYTPDNGNDNGVGTVGSVAQGGITYTARFAGTAAGNIQINMIQDFGVVPSAPILEYEQESIPGTLVVNIYVALAGATTATDVGAAINSHPYLGQMIFANVTAGATAQANFGPLTLGPGSSNPMDFFEYDVVDTSGAGNNTALFIGRHHITMNPTDDIPVICEYTKFNEAPECGLNGCLSASSPIGTITPSQDGLIYFNQTDAICYRSKNLDSSGALTSDDWEIIDSFVSDQVSNEMEKIVIDNIKIDEGGGDVSENSQGTSLIVASSSNTNLIPVANIELFYNDALVTSSPFEGGIGDASIGDVKIEITPAANQVGTSTIELILNDDGGNSRTVTFNVTINPVSIKHNGWKNISAIGPGVDPLGNIVDMSKVCNYSRTKCSGGECKGTSDPINAITPDKKYAIFYNSLSKQCFYANGTTSADWLPLDSYCNISPVEYVPTCSVTASPNDEGSCIGETAPSIIPSGENQFYYDVANNVCYRSKIEQSGSTTAYEAGDWEVYNSVAEATLEWEDFTIFGSGVLSGYNVYRRISGEEFDYDTPINKSPIGPTTNKYIDNAENSWYGPIPKTVYYYDVRPILNGLSTGVNEDYKEFNIVRVLVPFDNFAFVHRWIVNKSICQLMNSTTIDPKNDFRCQYFGPGATQDGTEDVYDIGKDMLVPRFEIGCQYTRASSNLACDTPTGDCTGLSTPFGSVAPGGSGAIFYDRSTGNCFRSTGTSSTTWILMVGNSGDFISNGIGGFAPKNPPLVNFSQVQADNYCDAVAPANLPVLGYGNVASPNSFDLKLPNRKDQIAYSLWDDVLNTDTQISILETGLSINSSSKCNSSNASGLENGYADTATTNSNTEYSMPGSDSSGIRSVITGSEQTKLCKSRFGVQDHVGNVAEFLDDTIDCEVGGDQLSRCRSVQGPSGNNGLTNLSSNGPKAWDSFRVNESIGPCRDTDSDGQCDAFIDQWILDEERYSAGRFSVPLGLPVNVNFPITFAGASRMIDYPYDPGSGVISLNFLSEIGPSSGILSDKLHDDVFALNTHHLWSTLGTGSERGEGAMTAGGSYLSGSGAGVWNAEFIPILDNARGFVTIGDVSFRMEASAPSDLKIDIQANPGPGSNCNYDGINTITFLIDPSTLSASSLVAISSLGSCSGLSNIFTAEVSGVGSNLVQTLTAPVSFQSVSAPNNRPNIGFRCIYDIDVTDYID